MAADKITEIVDQSAFDQVEKLKKDMTTLAATFVDLFKQAKSWTDALGSAKGIPEFKDNMGRANKVMDELDRNMKMLSKTRDQLSISENRYVLALAESRLALQAINQETKDAVKMNLAADGSINQMRLQLKGLQAQYDSLGKAARDAIGPGILTQIQKTDAELKKLEFSTGRFQRNVGNYASGFNALNNSIAQLTREAPAFANSINTGFMAISNNLPMLSDAIKGIRAENKALAAEGKPTVSVLKQLAAGFFSWQTLLSVGVTLLTIYGGKIVEMITKTKELDKETKDLAKSLGSESGKYETLTRIINSNVTSSREKLKAAKELRDLQPTILKNYLDEEIAAGKAAVALDKIKESVINLARAKAVQTKVDELVARQFELDAEKYNKQFELTELYRKRSEKQKIVGLMTPGSDRYTAQIDQLNTINRDIESTKQGIRDVNKEFSETNKAIDTLVGKIGKLKDGVADGFNDPLGKGTKDKSSGKTKEVNRIEDLKKEYENRRTVLQTAYNNGEVDFLNYQMKLLEIAVEYAKRRILVDESLTDAEKQSKIELLNSMSKDTKDIFSDLTDAGKAAAKRLKDDTAKGVDEASENITKSAKKIEVGFTKANTAIVNLGSTKTFEGFVKELEDLVKIIAPLFQSLSNIGGEIAGLIADKANFEADQAIKAIDKIEKAELDSLERMTMGAKQREEEKKKIEIQAEQRRAKAERDRITALRKAASIQKAADIAGIISGTAMAIVNALKTQPAPLGIALAAGVGVTGAIQLARAIQTPLPQYADGTDNHMGGAFIAGEAGIEQITTPDGKSFFTPDAATLFTAPKGTKVKSNEELLQDVYNTALIKLSAQGAVTHSKMDEALLEAFKENNSKLDNLTSVVKDLELSATFQNFSDHISHVKSRVR